MNQEGAPILVDKEVVRSFHHELAVRLVQHQRDAMLLGQLSKLGQHLLRVDGSRRIVGSDEDDGASFGSDETFAFGDGRDKGRCRAFERDGFDA